MRDRKTWRSELLDEIRTLASNEELRRLWSGKDPTAVSSFAEEVAHVFDDFDIDGFIAAGAAEGNLTEEQFSALRRFRDKFAEYVALHRAHDLGTIGHEAVLADPRWKEVELAAGHFVALLGLRGSAT